jgi:hypothetical protein
MLRPLIFVKHLCFAIITIVLLTMILVTLEAKIANTRIPESQADYLYR